MRKSKFSGSQIVAIAGLVAVGGMIGLVAPSAAQNTIVPVTCRFDTSAHRDSTIVTLSVRACRGSSIAPDSGLGRVIGAIIRQRFHLPPLIGMLFYPSLMGPRSVERSRELQERLFGTLALTVRRGGEITAVRWDDPTFDAATNDEILRTVGEAGGSGEGATERPPGAS
ncbi:MAG: hypothetical protein ACRELE_00460 [Gemmatimonadales bacterium]